MSFSPARARQVNKETTLVKRTIVAAAVLSTGMSAVSAQSNVTLYGIVDAGITHVSNDGPAGGRTTVESGQMQVSRWGLKGAESLGGGITARFQLESSLRNDVGAAGAPTGTPSTTSLFDRQATIGLTGKLGAIDIGRQYNLGIVAIGLADPMGLSFAATSPNIRHSTLNDSSVYGAYGANNGGTALRENNSIRYTSPSLSGFGFSVMRALGEQAGGSQRSSYQGVAASYRAGALSLAGSLARLKNATDTELLKSNTFGVKYQLPAATLKSTYSQNEFERSGRKISVFGVGADVPVAPALTLTGAFYNTRRSGDVRDDSQQYTVIARQALSKRSTVYASYSHAVTDSAVTTGQINLAGGIVAAGSDSANRFTVGVSHLF